MSKPLITFQMDALSIQQPWAWCVIQGYKPVENRTWATKRRGMHIIHTGKKFDQAGYDWVQATFPEIPLPRPEEFELGGIIGIANLVDCVASYDSPWKDPEQFGFIFAEPTPLPFISCRGALGFFRPKLGG